MALVSEKGAVPTRLPWQAKAPSTDSNTPPPKAPAATTRSTTTPRPYKPCWSRCSSKPTLNPPMRSPSTSTPPTDPLHGEQEDRFFHGYYNAYCYLPLYIFSGRHLLSALLRPANIDASAGALEQVQRIVSCLRGVWPQVKILLRADSGFAREELMGWCEQHQVDYLFGLARNSRLQDAIAPEIDKAQALFNQQQQPVRLFTDLSYRTQKSWSRQRRVVAKAEVLPRGPNPRFVVTSLPAETHPAQPLYEQIYCARGEMEEPHQGAATRPVRRSHLHPHLPGQSAPALDDFLRLCAGGSLAPMGVEIHLPGPGYCRFHPTQTAQDRRPGHHLGPSYRWLPAVPTSGSSASPRLSCLPEVP